MKNATHSRRVLIVVGSDRNGIAEPPPETCASVSQMRLGGDQLYRYIGITHIFIPALFYIATTDVRQSAIRIPRTDSSWRRQIFRQWFMVVAPETHWPKSSRRNRNIIIMYYCIVLFRVCRRGAAYLCELQVSLVSYIVWNETIIMYRVIHPACPPTATL